MCRLFPRDLPQASEKLPSEFRPCVIRRVLLLVIRTRRKQFPSRPFREPLATSTCRARAAPCPNSDQPPRDSGPSRKGRPFSHPTYPANNLDGNDLRSLAEANGIRNRFLPS